MKRTPLTRLNLLVGYYMPTLIVLIFAASTLAYTLDIMLTPELKGALAPIGTVYVAVVLLVAIPILVAAIALSQTINYLRRLNGYDSITNKLYVCPGDFILLVLATIDTIILNHFAYDRFAFRAHIGNAIATAYVTIDLYTLISISCIVLVLIRQIIFSIKPYRKSADANTEP